MEIDELVPCQAPASPGAAPAFSGADDGACDILLSGETVCLLPERALYWAREETLLVADVHWGKAAAFRTFGVAVPGGTTGAGLARLSAVLERTGARRLIFLGDLFHAREGKAPRTLAALAAWRASHPAVEMTLVRGNHDRHAGDPAPELRIDCLEGPTVLGPFVLTHHPARNDAGYVLAGHIHPAVRLAGRGRQRARLPCFWFGAEVGVLPAFGDFTGSADVVPAPDDRVYVVAHDVVAEVGSG